MAQGVAWNARRLGIPCAVLVPDHAPQTKLDAIERLGGKVVKVPFDRWWQVLVDHGYPGHGRALHPPRQRPRGDRRQRHGRASRSSRTCRTPTRSSCPSAAAGSPAASPSAVHALAPRTRVFACEVETAAPFSASLRPAGPSTSIYTPSFVDGIGAKGMLAEMWPLASTLLAGSLVVSLAAVAAAVKLLAERQPRHRRGRRRHVARGRARAASPERARSSASFPAATSIRASSPESCRVRFPSSRARAALERREPCDERVTGRIPRIHAIFTSFRRRFAVAFAAKGGGSGPNTLHGTAASPVAVPVLASGHGECSRPDRNHLKKAQPPRTRRLGEMGGKR